MSKELADYFRNLFVKKRQPAATHVLIIMVSEERRNRKPYSLPVQYVPYHTIRDQNIRHLSKSVKLKMTELGMTTVGKYSNDVPLRTFSLIVSAHPYCTRKFTCHVMHERAR